MRDYEIPDRQAEVDWLFETYLKEEEPQPHEAVKPSPLQDDARIIALCRSAKNSDKFLRLFEDGDDSEHSSRSEADLSLIGIMAFYTQAPSQLDRLFRLSALMRPKWDARRRSDGATYSTVTIEKALSSLVATYSPERPQEEDDGDLDLEYFEDGVQGDNPRALVDNVVPEAYLTILYGMAGSGKSYIALNMAAALSRGDEAWMNFKIARQCHVLYLDLEMHPSEQKRRAHRMALGAGTYVDKEHLAFSHNKSDLLPIPLLSKALEACKERHIDVLFIDPLGDLLEGNINDSSYFKQFYRAHIKPFLNEGITVIAIDHQGKLQQGELSQQKGAIGTVAKLDKSRSMIQVELSHREDDLHISTLRQTKYTIGNTFQPFHVHTKHSPGQIHIWREELPDDEMCEETSLPLPERVRIALRREPMTTPAVASYISSSTNKVHKSLMRLEDNGVVHKIGDKWELV